MSGGPEFLEVEQPFMDQLAMMGWKLITGSLDHPSVTGRETFREVFILDDLKKALKRINAYVRELDRETREKDRAKREKRKVRSLRAIQSYVKQNFPHTTLGRDKLVSYLKENHNDEYEAFYKNS